MTFGERQNYRDRNQKSGGLEVREKYNLSQELIFAPLCQLLPSYACPLLPNHGFRINLSLALHFHS